MFLVMWGMKLQCPKVCIFPDLLCVPNYPMIVSICTPHHHLKNSGFFTSSPCVPYSFFFLLLSFSHFVQCGPYRFVSQCDLTRIFLWLMKVVGSHRSWEETLSIYTSNASAFQDRDQSREDWKVDLGRGWSIRRYLAQDI